MHKRLAWKVRFLRIGHRWTQGDLAARANVSRDLVSRVERGLTDSVGIASIERLAIALDARAVVDLQWSGAELDRLMDAGHAAHVEWLAGRLSKLGWQVRPEASFNHFGERGRYDLLAMHPAPGVLLVVEVKTSVGDLQDLLGRLDVKVRLAPATARSLGWRGVATIPLLLLSEGTTNRRHVHNHPVLFGRFPIRGSAATSWLRSPLAISQAGLLLFRKLPYAVDRGVIGRQRVRKPRKSDQPDV